MSLAAATTRPLPGTPEWEVMQRTLDFHPIQIIPGFKNARRGPWRDLYLTLIWNTLLGIFFVAIPLAMGARASFHLLWFNVAIANCIGFVIHGLFVVGGILGIDRRIYVASHGAFAIYTTVVATSGVLLGFLVAGRLLDVDLAQWFRSTRWVTSIGISSVTLSLILAVIFFWRSRSAEAEAALERERVRTERIEREAARANLRALQAQIEPHFLFNTLANVTSLIEPDPARARHMLETFIRFLRASLGATRAESTTLAAEAELIGAYLEVLQVRMGPRLRFAIDIEPSLGAFAIPPMLLQPVVENAIRHGLEPKVEGGEVAFRARRDGPDVAIEVADTGVGFAPATAGGVGLTNLRDRLRLLFGERASLAIGENRPTGTLVTLRLPA